MRKRTFHTILEWDPDEQVWTTEVPALGIADWGETREEALANTREAIIGYFEAEAREGRVTEEIDLEVAVS